jgi:hypothetical protein
LNCEHVGGQVSVLFTDVFLASSIALDTQLIFLGKNDQFNQQLINYMLYKNIGSIPYGVLFTDFSSLFY